MNWLPFIFDLAARVPVERFLFPPPDRTKGLRELEAILATSKKQEGVKLMDRSCWQWHIDPECREWMLFGDCPECGDIASAVMPSGDFVGITEMNCQRVNDVGRRVPDGCGWKCQISVDVPKRKVYFVREVCSR